MQDHSNRDKYAAIEAAQSLAPQELVAGHKRHPVMTLYDNAVKLVDTAQRAGIAATAGSTPELIRSALAHLAAVKFNSFVLQECDACQAKPGMPNLCGACLHNRWVAGQLGLKFGQRIDLPLVRE